MIGQRNSEALVHVRAAVARVITVDFKGTRVDEHATPGQAGVGGRMAWITAYERDDARGARQRTLKVDLQNRGSPQTEKPISPNLRFAGIESGAKVVNKLAVQAAQELHGNPLRRGDKQVVVNESHQQTVVGVCCIHAEVPCIEQVLQVVSALNSDSAEMRTFKPCCSMWP
jgi:hypothetical protein